ncbi:MAG: DUF2380 domain-containing protein [Polyangiaceae bacterium]|nr:DUF2380 domain-containing protein [Polyangiaceae bacterium]
MASAGLVTAGAGNFASGLAGLGRALSTGSGAGAGSGSTAKPSTNKHHVFPQQFEGWFSKKGINIHHYTVRLPRSQHLKGVHGRGDDLLPGQWNQHWQEFIKKNPGASASDVFQFMEQLRSKYGIQRLPFESYR